MNTIIKNRRLKIASLLTLGVSTLLFAAAVFIPTTTPTVMIGQYALKNNDLLAGRTQAYRPWFENGAWQGDIIEYDILEDGTRETDAPVGSNPATAGTDGKCDFPGHSGSGCWTARATFIANGADSATGTYWQSRNIFTNNGGQVDFTWDNLSATQREAIDKETYDIIVAAAAAIPEDPDTSALNTADASDILNYIRGERLHERSNDNVPSSKANLRTRYSVLGDITSTPIYIGPPRETYGRLSGYIAFSTANATRDGVVASGANDGMLHVFDEDDGSEVFAYVPSMVFNKLEKLAARDTTYDHTYYVAGDLLSGSAYYASAWHSVLVGGGGPGFAGLYALDITEEAYPGTASKLILEKSSTDGFGYIYGKPQIAPVGIDTSITPAWYIFSGSGYSTSTGHDTALKIISLDDPSIVHTISTGTTGGLSAPALVSTDNDDMVELAFAGDLNGDLWMFTINQADPAATPAPIMIYDGSADQPITAAPTIGEHPFQTGYMLYFGTGSLLSVDDALHDGLESGGDPNDQSDYTGKQAIHGLWINTEDSDTMATLAAGTPYFPSDLQTQTLVETTATFAGEVETLRITPTENTINYVCADEEDTACTINRKKGWKVEFPNCGESLTGVPFLRAKRVQFLTNNPTGPANDCGKRRFPGDSWVMSLDFLYGTANNKVVYNLEPDNSLDDLDKVTYLDGKQAPVGINLGPGNIAQPTFARLKLGIDKMYINGIFLPLPPILEPGPILGGHIDVHTDSPTDGVIATNNRDKHSEGYSIRTHDGLGRGVDGHVHDYDTMHNVDWVDIFELEPRRGLANFIGGKAAAPVAGVCSTTENEKGVLVGSSCLQAIEGELNRAYDTLHTDQDGNSDPVLGPVIDGLPTAVLKSEVNSLGAGTSFSTIAPTTPFIITLANADRSNAGYIQIGCKVWTVVDYQDMITGKLLDGRINTTGLVDDDGASLVFTLAGIMNPADLTTCPGGSASGALTEEFAISKGLSTKPTLRIGFGQRSILDQGIHATRSQCVLGLHHYEDAVCFTDETVLAAAETSLTNDLHDPNYTQPSSCGTVGDTIPLSYVRDPSLNLHITKAPSSESSDNDPHYRWRNGALTVQLIKASINPTTDLQSEFMVSGAGTHARAYTVSGSGSNEAPTATETEESATIAESGLLHETTMYWHYSDLVDKIRNSDPDTNTTPKDAGCYGGGAYSGKNTIDIGGLTLGEYQALTDSLVLDCKEFDPESDENIALGKTVCDLERFGQLLEIIDNVESEEELNTALLELSELLELNQALSDYVEMRDYAGDKIPEQHKLGIDQQQNDDNGDDTSSSGGDGTPNDIETFEEETPDVEGPNSVFGRRNWIDLRQ